MPCFGILQPRERPGTAWLFLTGSFVCGLYFCIFLNTTVEFPGTAWPKPEPFCMLTALQLVCAVWWVPRVALGCGRRVKSSSRIGNGGTTSPRLQSTSPFGTSAREGEVRRSLLKMQKCRLLLETISMGKPAAEPSASAGGEGYVFVWMDSTAWLVASSSDGKST